MTAIPATVKVGDDGLARFVRLAFHLGFNTDIRAPAPDSLGVLMAALVELRGSR
jgi:hypothetical protein